MFARGGGGGGEEKLCRDARVGTVQPGRHLPSAHDEDLSQPTRKDEVTEENLREELLKNAPSVKSGLFLVPKVIDGDN